MANKEHLALLKRGVHPWNAWRRRRRDTRPDLSGADLSGMYLEGADLKGADLSKVYLRRADLQRADLSEADLSWSDLIRAKLSEADLSWVELTEADLSGADLSGADLRGGNLSGANLREADLTEAKLSGVDLSGANLKDAFIQETVFGDTDLTDAIGLDSCQHWGPSTIDFRTLRRSGKVALPFLRGCGLPDAFIEQLPALLSQPTQYHSCFISYSTKDQEFADRLYADLQNNGVRCWFAPHDIQAGKKVHEQINQAIHLHDRLLLILSEHSMSSEWVKTEIADARQWEVTEGERILFPIALVDYQEIRSWECFDSDTGKDSAREIREYFIPDFQDWKDNDAYQQSLDRLLRDLKA